MTQKQINPILSANGGLHSKRALKKVQANLQNHGLKRAILVHMVITGSQSVQVYRDTYNDIADHLRDHGSRCEYFGCLEMDSVKGLHCHILYVIETSKKFPHKTLDVSDGAWLHQVAERRGLNRVHIAQPQNKLHYAKGKPQFFARLTEKDGKLADCLARIEYLYKNRSKEGVPCREIYFNSEFKSNATKRAAKKAIALDCSPAALPAACKLNTEQDTTSKGDMMTNYQLTAAEQYVASKYEEGVDAGLDLDALRLYLLSHGIKRTPAQVVHELDEVYGFHQYASSHKAPPRPDVVELDRIIDRMPERLLRPLMGLTRHERTYPA
jgi:hypothetical protein